MPAEVSVQALREGLGAAVVGAPTALAAADRLCAACVDLLDVDGASISVVDRGTSLGTFGSSGELSRTVDALQFTYGEGPCFDAVASGRPVLAEDLGDAGERRWPGLVEALLGRGVRALYALPVSVSGSPVGALDLLRTSPAPLDGRTLTGSLWAAELAALPLLSLVGEGEWPPSTDLDARWEQVASLERVEVYQATGMIMEALGVSAAEALVRLRARAVRDGATASALAFEILDRRLDLTGADWLGGPEASEGPA